MEINSISSLLTMITQESIELQEKLIKVGTEQLVRAQEDGVVAEAMLQQGIDIYA
jgi:hypothetical protein